VDYGSASVDVLKKNPITIKNTENISSERRFQNFLNTSAKKEVKKAKGDYYSKLLDQSETCFWKIPANSERSQKEEDN
jgi:hypothetical protein